MRIFVPLGTHSQQFNRLLKKIDFLLREKKIKASVFAQIGHSNYKPKEYSFKKFLSPQKFEQEFKNSDLIISHAGAGSIINALKFQKPLIVVPRRKEYSEHTNNHQIDLAKALGEKKKAIAVLDLKELLKAIKKAKHFNPKTKSDKQNLVNKIREFLKGCE